MNEVPQMSILNLQRTSTMTMANEKISASLLNVPCLAKISGEVHRVLCSCSSGALRVESKFRVTTARPQSVICARPAMFIRTLGWLGVIIPVVNQLRMIAYPSEVSMYNVAEVEVIQTLCDIR